MATAVELYEETDQSFAESWFETYREDLEAFRRLGILFDYDDKFLFREGPFPKEDGAVAFRVWIAPAGLMVIKTLLLKEPRSRSALLKMAEEIRATCR